MNETKDKKTKTLSLGGTLSLKGSASGSSARKTAPDGRKPTVAVEVKRRRQQPSPTPQSSDNQQTEDSESTLRKLTSQEREARIKALRDAEDFEKQKAKEASERAEKEKNEASKAKEEQETKEANQRKKELEELQKIEEEEKLRQEQEILAQQPPSAPSPTGKNEKKSFLDADAREEESYRERMKKQHPKKPRTGMDRRRGGKLTVTQVLNEDYERDRGPSLAAQKRAREKARMAAQAQENIPEKIIKDVVVPETITVQELANRMAERSGDVIKCLINMGVMATVNQSIDADTAELVIHEFGHKIKRVTEADIEEGLEGPEDNEKDLKPRPPVVTIMGHVDHGKTSLLDVLRETDVVAGEAGGITQHIGAYQVNMANGEKITFLDTPGHAAFTEMRARGANVTDIVVLVVAANDSIMPQTIEAINHAKAADVPLIVAINKIDLEDSNPQKVKTDLLQHEVIPEDMGGEVQCVEISAKQKMNLDKLEEAILLQAEMLDLKANPDRDAVGTVIEAKLEQGRGNVGTILIQRGTLKIGDIFVVGSEWGKVRAMINDHGQNVEIAIPGQPIEVLGLNGAPNSGDSFIVVDEESKAREVAEYRARVKRKAATTLSANEGASFEELLAEKQESEKKALSVVIKADVHGSVEAILGSFDKLVKDNEDVRIQVLHTGVGGINESDVTLATASNALIIGFNVRANNQARELAEKENADMRYYNVIYNVIDDAKAILGGLLDPVRREEYLGQAVVKQVFKVSKIGNVAGCEVSLGVVKKGAGVRLLRDDVVIHEGTLKTLQRFKDEVKEVKEGTECGMAFENYDDIKDGDVIECFDVVEETRKIE
jgi:translation initiation factor IF-2